MRESQFETFLIADEAIESKEKAVNTRMSKARSVEQLLGKDLDFIVADDDLMFDSLLRIDSEKNNKNGGYSNSLRKYYFFINGKEFPRLATYKKQMGL